MTEREEHDKLADDLEDEADALEQKSAELEDQIGDARKDWDAKRQDSSVPGAPPPTDDEDA